MYTWTLLSLSLQKSGYYMDECPKDARLGARRRISFQQKVKELELYLAVCTLKSIPVPYSHSCSQVCPESEAAAAM